MVDFPASHVSFRRGTRRAVTKRHEPALPGMYRIPDFFSKTLSSFKLPIWHQNLTPITENHWCFFRYFHQTFIFFRWPMNFWRASAGVLGARPGMAGTGGAAESCRRSWSSSSCKSFSWRWPPSSKASNAGGKLQPRVFLEKSWQQHWQQKTVLIDMVNTPTPEISKTVKKTKPICSIWILEMGDNPKSSEDLQNTSQNHMTGLFVLVLSKFFYFAKKRNVNPPNKKKFKNITQKNERTW